MTRGKCPRIVEELEVEVLDSGFVAPPSMVMVNEWRSVLHPTTGECKILTIWDCCFNFPKLIDSFLVAKANEEKVRSLGSTGVCRAMQAYGCWTSAVTRSVEPQFGQMAEEKRVVERELAVLQGEVSFVKKKVTALEASLKIAEKQTQSIKQLKLHLQVARDE